MANSLQFTTTHFWDQLERATLDVLYDIHVAANEEATALANAVRAAYPLGKTGNLRAGVSQVEYRPRAAYGRFERQLGARVKSSAKHVHFAEHGQLAGPGRGNQRGSIQKSSDGWYRFVAAKKKPKGTSVIFVPLAVEARARFYARVQAVLDRGRVVR